MKWTHIILLGVCLLTGCKQEALLTGLDQMQANEIVALLQKNNIQAIKKEQAKTGISVTVSPEDFASAVDLMAHYNLPSRPRVDISELFPADALISSPRAEVARIYSGIEQRLEQTLNQLKGVVTSRVHVSYDMNNTETDKNRFPVHLSALLRINHEADNATNVIADVKRLLKNSFSNTEYENISVVLTPVEPAVQWIPGKVTTHTSTLLPWIIAGSVLLLLMLVAVGFYVKRDGLIRKEQQEIVSNESGSN
ncbi:type III secretion inner membrane ring lipoprotein SctJ [Pantoea sp.]|uniref:type III secretion system inner membrane ring lipoprotein SctJ n=1 Tax=Pantoea sp. TaxID=69393 RepID=UPI0031D050E8